MSVHKGVVFIFLIDQMDPVMKEELYKSLKLENPIFGFNNIGRFHHLESSEVWSILIS